MTLYKTIATKDGGVHVEMTAEEEAVFLAEQAANIAAQPRLDLLDQIAALELQQTPRRMRESLTDPTFINNLDAQIAALRSRL